MGFDIRGAAGSLINRGREAINTGRETINRTADQVRETVQTGANTVRDTFQAGVEAARPVVDFVRGRTDDLQHDGAIVNANGTTQPPGSAIQRDPNKPLVLYVNGIGNDVGDQTATLNEIQNRTGAQAVGIHNATAGHLRDLGQSALDLIGKGRNPAVDSMADQMYTELQAGRPVHVMAHSQGALVTARALDQVKQRMMMEGGLTQAQAEQRMGNIQVETFGGAAPNFTDGPQYVHYVNRADPVPVGVGLGPGIPGLDVSNPGRNARVHYFTENHNSLENHSINTTYMNHRVPFDQARRGDFSNPGNGL